MSTLVARKKAELSAKLERLQDKRDTLAATLDSSKAAAGKCCILLNNQRNSGDVLGQITSHPTSLGPVYLSLTLPIVAVVRGAYLD